jgi:hypothetical protein
MRRRLGRTLPAVAAVVLAVVAVLLATSAASAAPPAHRILLPRVVGGAAVRGNQYPYTARVVVDGLGTCSGVLVARRFVLTAGHCATESAGGGAITDASRFHVRVGNQLPAADRNGYVAVAQVIRHPAFDPDLLLNDVTMLRLAAPVDAPTIDLLPPSRAALMRPPGSAVIAGYGLITQDPMELLAPKLYAGRIRLMSDAACRREWHGDFDRRVMFCAGPVGTRTAETCAGDSGGPLLVLDPVDHRRFVAGSTSFGAEDCRASSSVFARLWSGSIRNFVIRTAGLGPATVGAPTLSAVGDTGGTITATVTPRGADVYVSARYGARFAQATHAVRVGGEAPVAVSIRLHGLAAGRSRGVRLVVASGYGVRHSAPVTLTTTDHVAPTVTALAVRGSRGQRVRLRFRPADASQQVAVLGEVLAGGARLASVGSLRRFRNIQPHATYFLSFRLPAHAHPTRWCIAAYDRAGHRSTPSCARVTVTRGRVAARPARPFA